MDTQDTRTLRLNKDFWFACVDIEVLCDKTLSQSARYIFSILCVFATTNNRGVWPSNEAVAEIAGVSVSTVIRAYKELANRGVIARSDCFKDGRQISSHTRLIGHNAPCYDTGVSSVPYPPSKDDIHGGGMDDIQKETIRKDIKDSLTREEKTTLPDRPEPEIPDSPKELYTPEDAPDIMKPTAELFLHKTGHKGLTWDDISALRELAATQYPSRVQKEIDRACERFRRKGNSLDTLTLSYIAGSLKHQPSRNKPKTPKPDQPPQYTDAEIDAVMAENEALQAELEGAGNR